VELEAGEGKEGLRKGQAVGGRNSLLQGRGPNRECRTVAGHSALNTNTLVMSAEEWQVATGE
jgi:hypothetical protein